MTLAVVTNYYNPSNNPVKLANFNRFREGIGNRPLFIIEAAFGDDPFSVDGAIQIRCQSVLWQQYRLVNHVIKSLPDKYDKAVWVDADILFDDPDWYEKMDESLSSHKMVQSFSEITLLKRDGSLGERKKSVAKVALENSKLPWNKELSSCLDLSKKFASGFSWGVQREVVEKHGIYNYWITGSDDIAFIIAIWGDWGNGFMDRVNDTMQAHYFEWAKPFHEYIDGSVGCLEGHIHHLWHGNRNYRKRWNCLRSFDPYRDVRIADNGALEWCSDKPKLHKCCQNMCLNYDRDFKLIL